MLFFYQLSLLLIVTRGISMAEFKGGRARQRSRVAPNVLNDRKNKIKILSKNV